MIDVTEYVALCAITGAKTAIAAIESNGMISARSLVPVLIACGESIELCEDHTAGFLVPDHDRACRILETLIEYWQKELS